MRLKALDKGWSVESDLVNNGAWCAVAGVGEFLCRYQSSNHVRQAAAERSKKHALNYSQRKLPSVAELDADEVEVLAQAVVIGWRDAGLGQGELDQVPYSVENARALLSEPDYQPLRSYLDRWSSDRENYRRETVAAMGKTLPPLSEPNSEVAVVPA